MSNTYFQFKEFVIHQEHCAMKVCTDSCVFGAWASEFAITKSRILDIGAGTGLLMLMLAQKSSASIEGIEIEPRCFEQLKANLVASSWSDRLHAIRGDVRELQVAEKYDFIISNPPFFSLDLLSETESNRIARHSTELSLKALFEIVSTLLLPEGNFALLLPYHRLQEVRAISQDFRLNILHQVSVFQTPKHNPFRLLLLFGKDPVGKPGLSDFVIKNKAGYTPEFVELLKGYYLTL